MNNLTRRSSNSPIKVMVWAGLVAGVLDLAAAVITTLIRGGRPVRMLQSIASGVLGANSFQAGSKSAVLGVFLHFVIAFGWAVAFYLLSRKFTFLTNQALISGLIYGVVVYFLMNLVVLPLSAVPFKPSFRATNLMIGLPVHMLCVGLPIAFVVRHFSRPHS